MRLVLTGYAHGSHKFGCHNPQIDQVEALFASFTSTNPIYAGNAVAMFSKGKLKALC